jgi:UDP-N-acetyl-D-mannosaminuronate dehydrogenase
MGADMRVHDPYVDHWYEFETQDEDPDHSWARFFRNQDQLTETVVEKDLEKSLKGVEAIILAVPHKQYKDLNPADIVKWAEGPIAVIDAFGILPDDKIREYFKLGCEVKALGRGHIQRIKKETKNC